MLTKEAFWIIVVECEDGKYEERTEFAGRQQKKGWAVIMFLSPESGRLVE
jgi:hypothetical protein